MIYRRLARSKYVNFYAPQVAGQLRRKALFVNRARKSPMLRHVVGKTAGVKSEVGDVVELSDLDEDEYSFSELSQDIDALFDYIGTEIESRGYERDDVTVTVVVISDGDYDEVWVTDSSSPYSLSLTYERVY